MSHLCAAVKFRACLSGGGIVGKLLPMFLVQCSLLYVADRPRSNDVVITNTMPLYCEAVYFKLLPKPFASLIEIYSNFMLSSSSGL